MGEASEFGGFVTKMLATTNATNRTARQKFCDLRPSTGCLRVTIHNLRLWTPVDSRVPPKPALTITQSVYCCRRPCHEC